MKPGDDPQWASPGWRDDDWTAVELNAVQSPESVLWLRAKIHLTGENMVPGHPLGLEFGALASHEIYWDGVLIGSGGTVGSTKAAETPGPIQAHYVIPDRVATPGQHLIAVRTSAHHRHFRPAVGYWYLIIGDYDRLVHFGARTTFLSLASLSGMLVVAIFAFLLFLIDRSDRSYLLLALIGAIGALLLIAEAWRNLYGYTYNWHLLRLAIVAGLSAVLNFTFLLFSITRFPGKHSKLFLALTLLGFSVAMTARGWDSKAGFMFLTGISLSFVWTLRAALQRRRGARLAAAGFAATGFLFFWPPYLFADFTLYFGIDFLLLCLLAAHVLQVRQVRAEREQAFLKSARLEIELLKKYIQPHYLMNTLTALAEWIEEEPREATKMVHFLSTEFRLLSEVSHRSLIALEEELRLCRSHMEIMSRRKGRFFVLTTDGLQNSKSMVPPAVFHTLVENAIVHNKHTTDPVPFTLASERENGFLRFVFTAPLGTATPPADIKEGTGFRYIKARLRENYGDHWKFIAGHEGNLWKAQLWIPARNE